MPEDDNAIDDELEKGVAVVRIDPADLLRDDAGQFIVKKPIPDAIDFPTLGNWVIEETQEHVDPVEDNPFRLKLIGLGLKDVEHSDQVEFPSLDDLRGQLRVQEKEFLLCQRGKIPPECGGAGEDLAGAFLEGDKNSRLLSFIGASNQRLECEYGLSATRAAHHETRSSARQPAVCDFVESLDAGEDLCDDDVRGVDLH